MFFTDAMFNALRVDHRQYAISWCRSATLDQVGDVIFRRRPPQTPVVVSIIVLLAAHRVSALVLERRVRGVEVVA